MKLSKSFIELCKGRWREFRREPSAFFWVMFMPLLSMIILGLSFSKPRTELYSIGIDTTTEVPASFVTLLQNSQHIKIAELSYTDIDRAFKRGQIVIALSFRDEQLNVLLDPSNPDSAHAKRFVEDLLQTGAGRKNPLSISETFIETKGGRYIDFLVPGLLALSIMTSSLFGIGMTLVSNRKEGLLKRYLATPMRKSEFLVSHMVGRFIVLCYEFGTVIISSFLIFRFSVQGNFLTFFLLSILGSATFTAIALLCASRTASIPAMGGMVNLISLPMMMFSGVFFSKTNFPDWMQGFINVLPLTALADGLRKVALEAGGLNDLYREMVILLGYLAVALVAARLRFKWY